MKILYKYIFPLIAVLLVALIAVLIYSFTKDNPETTNTTSSSTSTTESTNTTNIEEPVNSDTETFTRAEVTKADTINNCLFIYKTSVYRIPTTWPNEHPGGRTEIISNCGKDVTTLFDTEHKGKPDAKTQLQEFYAGELAE